MTYTLWIWFSKHARTISIAIYAAIALGFVLAGYFAATTLFTLPRINSAKAAIKTKGSDLLMAAHDIQNLKVVAKPDSGLPGNRLVQNMQAQVVNEAATTGCLVAQFNTQATPSAYVSHFGGASDGYQMYHIRMTVSGNMGRVLDMLQRLCDDPIPFEFASINLMPDSSAGKGTENNVIAAVEMEVIAKSPGDNK